MCLPAHKGDSARRFEAGFVFVNDRHCDAAAHSRQPQHPQLSCQLTGALNTAAAPHVSATQSGASQGA